MRAAASNRFATIDDGAATKEIGGQASIVAAWKEERSARNTKQSFEAPLGHRSIRLSSKVVVHSAVVAPS